MITLSSDHLRMYKSSVIQLAKDAAANGDYNLFQQISDAAPKIITEASEEIFNLALSGDHVNILRHLINNGHVSGQLQITKALYSAIENKREASLPLLFNTIAQTGNLTALNLLYSSSFTNTQGYAYSTLRKYANLTHDTAVACGKMEIVDFLRNAGLVKREPVVPTLTAVGKFRQILERPRTPENMMALSVLYNNLDLQGRRDFASAVEARNAEEGELTR